EAARVALEQTPASFVPSHIDPVPHNFVRARDGALYLLVLESAAMGEQMWAAVGPGVGLDRAETGRRSRRHDARGLFRRCRGTAGRPLRALQGVAQPLGGGLGGGAGRRRERERRLRGLLKETAGLARGRGRERGLSRVRCRATFLTL